MMASTRSSGDAYSAGSVRSAYPWHLGAVTRRGDGRLGGGVTANFAIMLALTSVQSLMLPSADSGARASARGTLGSPGLRWAGSR